MAVILKTGNWVLHLRSEESYKCNICDQTFPNESNFMMHRKQHHNEMVQVCKSGEKCVYKDVCWYRHKTIDTKISETKISEENDKNEKSIKKLEGIFENLIEKVTKLDKMVMKDEY